MSLYQQEFSRITHALNQSFQTGKSQTFTMSKKLSQAEQGVLAYQLAHRHPNIDFYSRGYGHPMMDLEEYGTWYHCRELAGPCYSVTGEYKARFRFPASYLDGSV